LSGHHLHLHSFPTRRSSDLESRTFRIRQRMDVLASRADNGLYPLKLELRSHDQAVAALRTPMIFLIERPRVPLNLAWTWVLSEPDRKSTRLNSSHVSISYAV